MSFVLLLLGCNDLDFDMEPDVYAFVYEGWQGDCDGDASPQEFVGSIWGDGRSLYIEFDDRVGRGHQMCFRDGNYLDCEPMEVDVRGHDMQLTWMMDGRWSGRDLWGTEEMLSSRGCSAEADFVAVPCPECTMD